MHLPTTLLTLTSLALVPLTLAENLNFTQPAPGTKLNLEKTIKYSWSFYMGSPELDFDEMDISFHIKDRLSWTLVVNMSVAVGGGMGDLNLGNRTDLTQANLGAEDRVYFEAKFHDKNNTRGPAIRSAEFEFDKIKGSAAAGVVRAGTGVVAVVGMGVLGVLMV